MLWKNSWTSALLLLLLLWQTTQLNCFVDSVEQPELITDPAICVSDTECPVGKQCDNKRLNATFNCIRQARLGKSCKERNCAPGLYCNAGKASFHTDRPKTCRKQIRLGGKCDPKQRHPCVNSPTIICSKNTLKCVRNTLGFLGKRCYKSKCRPKDELYCDRNDHCKRRLPPGSKCDYKKGYAIYSSCSNGVCAWPKERNGRNFENPVLRCVQLSSIGGLCRRDSHCSQLQSTGAPIICNIPRGLTGKCFPEDQLYKTLAVPCDPTFDKCDARRGLSCRWILDKRANLCAQRTADEDRGIQFRYCTPGAAVEKAGLSRCSPSRGIPMVCRKSLWGDTPHAQFAVCRRKFERRRLGELCTTRGYQWNGGAREYITCARGSYCTFPRFVPQFRWSSTAFCIKPVGAGKPCRNSFKFVCQWPLICSKQTYRCVAPGTAGDHGDGDTKQLYAALFIPCGGSEDNPCARGLVYPPSKFGSLCLRPVVTVKRGMPCFETANVDKVCEKGFVCRINSRGFGIQRCRRPAGLGDACLTTGMSERTCKRNLSCGFSSQYVTGMKCQKSRTAIPRGGSCKPAPNDDHRGCDIDHYCLRKKNGQYACQHIARIFQGCNDNLDVSCVDGSSCNNLNICV